MRINTGRFGGFTLVELMIVVSLIGLLLAIAIPNFVKSRDTSQLTAVFNNLRLIETAKDQWALENKKGTGDPSDLLTLSDYLKGGTIKAVVSEVYESNLIGSRPFATHTTRLGTFSAGDPIIAP
jgi:prepilin-type N-terminal cleavage/methylation domain-containing protein